MANNRIKGITIDIGANTVKLTDALKATEQSLSKTQASLKDVNKLLKLDPTNTQLLAQKHELLGKAVDDTKKKLQQEKEALEQLKASPDADKTIEQQKALEREIVSTTAMLKSYQSELRNMPSALSNVAKATGDLADKTKALSALSGAALAGLGTMAVKAATTADDLNTLAKQTGFTTEELQKMRYASDRVDVSAEDMTGSLQKMIKQMGSGSDAFSKIGVSITEADGSLRNANTVWYETLEALSQVENETERDTLAMDIFGKSAASLAGIIDDGGAALREYGEDAEKLGLIMSQDTLDAANKLNDAIDLTKARLQATFLETGAKVAEVILPLVEDFVVYLADLIEKVASMDEGTIKLIGSVLLFGTVLSPVLKLVSGGIQLFSGMSGILSALSGTVVPAVASAVSAAAASIGVSLTAMLGIIGLVTAAVAGLIAAFIQMRKEAKEAKAIANDMNLKQQGYTPVSAGDEQYYNKSDLYSVWNGSGWDSYAKPGAKYDWSAKNDAYQQQNNYNFDVNVSQVSDLQDLLNMADTAQLYSRMGVAN